MLKFITKRLLKAIPQLIVISMIIFGIIAMVPGDFVSAQSNPNMRPEQIARLREIYDLDKPLHIRYVKWAGNAIKGDFGDSLSFNQPVSSVIGGYIWNSFYLSFTSLIITLLIGVPLGIICAVKQYSIFDKISTVFVFISLSIPSFFLALVLVKVFALDLKICPLAGMTTTGGNLTGMAYFIDVAKHMILPVITLSLLSVGAWMKYVRNCMLEVINQDYIRTARAKGLKEKVVIYKHALRNAAVPMVTYLGLCIPGLFAGAIITETVFAWPGVGRLAYEAIGNRDYTLLMGFNMLSAVLLILGNLLADVLYSVVDPRVKLK
ncbi:ABC transporter permease [Clostridium butyricum]|uniref:ABC transporter permease n=1 Tax=Clostridium butyricum TaxID=1492 RepID=UPI0005EB9A37|nr:ABC transporter permease [Clostridium butyricum]